MASQYFADKKIIEKSPLCYMLKGEVVLAICHYHSSHLGQDPLFNFNWKSIHCLEKSRENLFLQ